MLNLNRFMIYFNFFSTLLIYFINNRVVSANIKFLSLSLSLGTLNALINVLCLKRNNAAEIYVYIVENDYNKLERALREENFSAE